MPTRSARALPLDRPRRSLVLAAAFLAAASLTSSPARPAEPTEPAAELLSSLAPELRAVVDDAWARSPDLAAARATVEALGHVPEQARALPDPMASATVFALPPETRVGPQRLSIGARQRLPWPERRRLAGQRAELATERAATAVDRLRLDLLLRIRELWIEIAFLDEQDAILEHQARHLELHEDAARARYAAGTGPASGPIRLQAETTSLQTRRLTVEDRRAVLVAELASLRDRSMADPASAIPRLPLVDPSAEALDDIVPIAVEELVAIALERRPELARAKLDIETAALGVEVAETKDKPDLEVGLAWTLVDHRDDPLGRMNPPDGDGDDILALTAALNIPLHRERRRAELAEASAHELVAGRGRRAAVANVRHRVEALTARLPIEAKQLVLLRDVLLVQAQEAVDSAVAGYRAGSLQALDLLDAEHRLHEVLLAVARARADLAVTLARLEDAIVAPLAAAASGEIPSAHDTTTDPATDPTTGATPDE